MKRERVRPEEHLDCSVEELERQRRAAANAETRKAQIRSDPRPFVESRAIQCNASHDDTERAGASSEVQWPKRS